MFRVWRSYLGQNRKLPRRRPDRAARRMLQRLRIEHLESRLAPASFVVESTGDHGAVSVGGVLEPSDPSRPGYEYTTLRSVIECINDRHESANPIAFDVAGGGVQTITPVGSGRTH
jgi:hypothetical protein